MAFPAYQFMNTPEERVETEDEESIITMQQGGLLNILPPIMSLFLENVTRSELLSKIGLEISSEAVDDIPVILATLLKMDVPNQIDSCFVTHGNREGLSLGWLLTVWLVYIISQQDHRMNHVRDWVKKRQDVLESLIGQSISETDFTDDRLADGLRYLSQLASWNSVRARTSKTHNSCLRFEL